MNPNTTLYELLKEGCEIKFLSGFIMRTYTGNENIYLHSLKKNRLMEDEGICDLTEKGLNEAIGIKTKFEK